MVLRMEPDPMFLLMPVLLHQSGGRMKKIAMSCIR